MITFRNVSKVYPGGKTAVQDFNATFEHGEFIVFIGTSGSGKTTAMRMINRMIEPTTGTISIDGKDIHKTDEVQLRRRIGYVIQQIGLMPHMTIYDNIVMVPKLLKWPEAKMRERAVRLLARVDLPESILERYPSELSGGQQQRIGVIRALAADQDIILMDEPFGALDPITRDTLQQLVKRLQRELGKTIVFVTHDMQEAIQLADRILIMDKGEIVQFDTPQTILLHPATSFVEELIGEKLMNQAIFDYHTVETIMNRSPISIGMDITLLEATTTMANHRVDTLFVLDDHRLFRGLIDIFDIMAVKNRRLFVADHYRPAFYIHKDTPIREAIFAMGDRNAKNLPVIDDDGYFVGLVTRASIVEVISENIMNTEDASFTLQATDSALLEEVSHDSLFR